MTRPCESWPPWTRSRRDASQPMARWPRRPASPAELAWWGVCSRNFPRGARCPGIVSSTPAAASPSEIVPRWHANAGASGRRGSKCGPEGGSPSLATAGGLDRRRGGPGPVGIPPGRDPGASAAGTDTRFGNSLRVASLNRASLCSRSESLLNLWSRLRPSRRLHLGPVRSAPQPPPPVARALRPLGPICPSGR